MVKVSSLKLNDKNPRQIRDERFEKLKRSIDAFPQMMELRPIVVDESNVVLGGNMRLRAIKALGLKEIPDAWVKRTDELTDEQKREFVIKDNNSFGEYDFDILANEWSDLPLADWGLDVPGFEAIDEPAGDADAEPQIDKAAELNKKWKVKSGDLWQIGEHRLLCGDSTKKEDVERLMGGQTIDAVVTSPPYNSGDVAMRGGGNFSFAKKGAKTLYSEISDDKTPEEYFSFCIDILNNIASFVSDLHCVFWNVSYNANSRDDYGKIIFSDANPFRVKETIIWDKGHALPITSEGILSRVSELIFLLSKGDKYLTNQKIGAGSVYWNTWRINTGGSQESDVHKACFPLELPVKVLTDFTTTTANVYEPFAGSGTTLVACQNLNRKCYAIEISENYCAVILERMQTAFPDIEIKRLDDAKSKAKNNG